MTEHVSTLRIERFSVGALPEAELDEIARHLFICATCDKNFAAALRRQRGSAPLSFSLAPETWFRHEHLDYEQLVEIAEDRLDTTDREIIDIHLNICPTCREDVRSFLAFRKDIAKELETNYLPARDVESYKYRFTSIWRGLFRSPAYAIGVLVLLGIALTIAVLLSGRRSPSLQTQGNRRIPTIDMSPVPTPPNKSSETAVTKPPFPNNVNKPSLPKVRHQSRRIADTSVVALNDAHGVVTVDGAGRLTGARGVSVTTQREIADAVREESLERPGILKDLGSHTTASRGSSRDRTFSLVYPVELVISSDRPTFKWEGMPNATSYRVIVGDTHGREATKSDELGSDQTEWTPTVSLKRGKIYSWVVVAVIDGKEVVAPGPASPEVKFQLLATNRWQELHRLKKTRSHIALGVFYVKAGMLAEAEHEFEELVRLNQNSRVANNLLQSVRSMRSPDSK